MTADEQWDYLDDTAFVDWCGNRGIDLEEVDDVASMYANYLGDLRIDDDELDT